MVLLFFYAGRRWGSERPLIASCYSLRQGTLPERAMKVRKAWLADADANLDERYQQHHRNRRVRFGAYGGYR
jgi:hypothetical protein